MKNIFFLLLIFLCSNVTAQELLKNGNFDNGSTNWTTACTGIEAYANETSYGGPNAANRVAEIDDQSCFYQDICVLPGKDYQFSMTASRRTGGGGSPNPLTTNIKIEGLNAANAVVTTYVNLNFTMTNTTFALTRVAAIPLVSVAIGSGVVRLRVTLMDNTAGTSTLGMVVDSLSLMMLMPPVIVAKDTVCKSINHVFSIQNLPASGIIYSWDFGPNASPNTSTAASPSVQWIGSGAQQVTCVLSNGSCDVLTLIDSVFVLSDERTSRSYRACPGSAMALTANGTSQPVWNVLPGGDDLSSLTCVNCLNPDAHPTKTTTYYASSTMPNGCFSIDTVKLTIDTVSKLTMLPESPLVLCAPDSIHLSAVATGPKPLENLLCATISAAPSTSADTIMIIPSSSPEYKVQGSFASPTIAGAATVKHQYLVRTAELRSGGMTSGTLSGMAFKFIPNIAATTITNVKISVQCTNIQSMDASLGFVGGSIPVYSAATITIPAQQSVVWFPFNTLYNKDTAQNLLIEICYTNTTAPAKIATTEYAATDYIATLYANSSTGDMCSGGASTVVLGVKELPIMLFSYYLAVDGDFSYKWLGSMFTPSDTINNTSTYASQNKTIVVTSGSRYGCLLTDTLQVLIPQGHQALNSNDTSICTGASVALDAINGDKYTWYENGYNTPSSLSCADCAAPVATPVTDTRYNVVISELGCADTFAVAIDVTPYPELIVTPKDATVPYLSKVQLQVSGADKYKWKKDETLSATDIPNPVATPSGETIYTVKGYFEKNPKCVSTADVHINVDYHANLFVPTAFTPNGDGKNDKFRVANITFQDVPVFKVYNRWGKQIFNAGDNSGWDGTYDGAPQDMGVYFYLIKVVIPDGTETIYKGEVTLLR